MDIREWQIAPEMVFIPQVIFACDLCARLFIGHTAYHIGNYILAPHIELDDCPFLHSDRFPYRGQLHKIILVVIRIEQLFVGILGCEFDFADTIIKIKFAIGTDKIC